MNSDLKNLLNNLKCPICLSQIDLRSGHKMNYGCVKSEQHYFIEVRLNVFDLPFIMEEHTIIYDKKFKYSLIKEYNNSIFFRTKILASSIDGEGRVIYGLDRIKFETEQDLFDFSNFDIKKALRRIKTAFTFN